MRRVLIFISFFLLQPIIAQKPVIITDFVSREPITDYQVYFYHDPNCNYAVTDLLESQQDQFKRIDFSNEESGLEKITAGECIWFRFIFDNRSTRKVSFHLQPNIFSTFGRYTLFQRYNNGIITGRNSGYLVQPDYKDMNISGSDDLRFFIPPAKKDTLLLRAELIDQSVLSDLTFTVSTHDSVLKKDRLRRIIFGLFLGIMLIMVLYHLTLYLQVREVSYMYYIMYILAFLAFFINKEGFIYELTPQFTSAPINTFLLEVFLLFFLLFGRAYLDTKKRLPEWDRILVIAIYFIISGLALLLLMLILEGKGNFIPPVFQIISLSINIISALASLFLIILPTLILKQKKFPPARYFLVANIFLIVGITILTLFNERAIGKHGLEIGVTLQIVTFSVGLGGKINLLKRDREFAQRKIIDQLRENAALKDKVNRELEDKVLERTKEISMQKEQIERQNKEIKYSFDYAKRIQSTVLPQAEVFENLFAEHFIFFKPRDIVSGDFYWITQKEELIFITASDCTGHGVPGSLMSMLGITMLHEIVNEKDFRHTDKILNELRINIARTLKQEGKPGEQKDGMDMVMLIYNRKTAELEFSGANNPMYLIRNREMIEYKGNNMPVAYFDNMSDFNRTTIQLEKGDRIYLFTDGFPDQFGGPNNKKFKYKPFKELLIEMHDRPMEEQRKILQMVFEEWKGEHAQIDDVMVMGLRF
ncbi:MAG TPA: 7TM diverse intracellular signaling domain-containing protein [Bacteroidales bacterium]|nr:7TM diverse intracellular signaling domain-containing protein [Bacteroidales bacterium]